MSRQPGQSRLAAIGLCVVAVVCAFATVRPSQADWLTRLARQASQVGSHDARPSIWDTETLAARIDDLDVPKSGLALAAHLGNNGHWTFINKKRERFTANSADEVARAIDVLGGQSIAGPKQGLTLVVAGDTLFRQVGSDDPLALLPRRARLLALINGRALEVVALNGGKTKRALAVRRNVLVPLTDAASTHEAVWQLNRQLRPKKLTVVTLVAGQPQPDGAPFRTSADGLAVRGEQVQGTRLAAALPALRQRTVIMTGRIDGDVLTFRSAAGLEETLDLSPVRAAAAAHDINLLLIHAPTPRQPGARNWFWQRASVDGLNTVLQTATYADLLSGLAGQTSQMRVRVRRSTAKRTVLIADPATGADPTGVRGIWDRIASELLSETVGTIVPSAFEADVTSSTRHRELGLRLVPMIPSGFQIGYLITLVLGVVGLRSARLWWFHVWPKESRREYASLIGYHAARSIRLIVFLAIFLPLVGLPAFVFELARMVWRWSMLPWRLTAAALERKQQA